MTWYAFQGYNSGKAIDVAGIQEKDLTIWGFHGYSTEALAESHPNSVSIFTAPIVNLIIADYKTALQQGAQPGGPNASNPVAAAAQGVVNSVASGLGLGNAVSNIDDFFAKLKDANTWLRIGEVLLGVLLIAASVGKLTGANNVITSAVKNTKVIPI